MVSTDPILSRLVATPRDVGVNLAVTVPGLALQLELFVLLLYGLLLRHRPIRDASVGAVAWPYHDILLRLHDRTWRTLFSLYILQVATAAGTFPISLVLLWALDYETVLSFVVIAGVSQFVLILGASIVVVVLTVGPIDIIAGSLAVALLTEAVTLLAESNDGEPAPA